MSTAFLDLHGKTNKLLRALADARMQELGLHDGQNHLLAALWELDGRTPGEIASALHVATPTVAKMAARMEAAGWIERHPDAHDHRLVRLWLTPAGRSLKKPVLAARDKLEQQVTGGLTKAERETLLRALEKIYGAARALR